MRLQMTAHAQAHLRAERGAAGEPIVDAVLRDALDQGTFDDDDGTLLYCVRFTLGRGPARSLVIAIQPGAGRVYDDLARRVLNNLLRPG